MIEKVRCMMDKKENIKEFQQDLLTWYDAHARILPWRDNPTPYHVWVSEIMLQQTRVEAVKPYFERFTSTLPDITSLAEADDDVLSKLWEGLGYYHRVRNMKACAVICVKEHGGVLPHTYEELLKLPGIGSYSAGAIASIAYKQPCPAIDGNVLRVFSRLMMSYDDILKEKTKKKFQEIVQVYIPKERPDAFNQALMEIGAMICIPNGAPKCGDCPIHRHCEAYRFQCQMELPIKTAKKKRRREDHTILVLVHDHNVLLHQRENSGLLASLYEFINLPYAAGEQELYQLLKQSGVLIKTMVPLHDAKHIFSHIEWHMQGYLVIIDEWNCELRENHVWASEDQLDRTYAIPTALKVYRDALRLWWKGEYL